MLDLGCGSGILSIISLMLGAKEATAVDIDPNAVDIAYDNAARNGVDKSHYTVLSGNLVTDEELGARLTAEKYEVVAANIVADVIIAIAPMAKRCMKEDGVFITSGIIEDRIDDVCNALAENGFKIKNINRRKDWAAIVCTL
jgi:ribosomal protein L11 methyltransferase